MVKWLAGGLITLAAGLIIAATGWNFTTLAAVPEKYATKERVERVAEAIEERQHRLEDKVDRLIDHLIKN